MKDVISLPRFMPGHRRASHRRFEGSEGPARKGDCDRVASSELLDGVERLRFDTPLMEPDVQICRVAQLLLAFTPPGRTEAQTGLLRRMPTSPRSLLFGTAGFPQYGWKAALSDGASQAFGSLGCCRRASPAARFASVLRASPGNDDCPAQCREAHPLMHRRGG